VAHVRGLPEKQKNRKDQKAMTFPPYPVEVVVAPTKTNGLTVASAIELGQIRSVDGERLLKRLGTADAATMRKVDDALRISLGLVQI